MFFFWWFFLYLNAEHAFQYEMEKVALCDAWTELKNQEWLLVNTTNTTNHVVQMWSTYLDHEHQFIYTHGLWFFLSGKMGVNIIFELRTHQPLVLTGFPLEKVVLTFLWPKKAKKVSKTTAFQYHQCFSDRLLLMLARRAKWLERRATLVFCELIFSPESSRNRSWWGLYSLLQSIIYSMWQ